MTEGDQIFVAVWGSESTGAVAAPIGRSVMVLPVESGWRLTIGFNKITKKMVSYRYQSW